MTKKDFLALFINSLSVWFIGVSLMPVLPLYAAQLGATPAVTGHYLAVSFLALTLGTMSAGRMAERLHHRRRLIALLGLLTVPTTLLMGQVNHLWQLATLTILLWFAAGISLTLQSILLALLTAEGGRGRYYGLLSTSAAFAGLTGGFIVGPIVDRWGYPPLFAGLSLTGVIQVWSGRLLPQKEDVPAGPAGPAVPLARGSPFSLLKGLFVGNLLISIVLAASGMVQPIAMSEHGLTVSAITMMFATQSGLTILLNPLVGRFSDQLPRQTILMLAYMSSTLGMLLLFRSATFAAFWLASALRTTSWVKDAITPALIADQVTAEQVGGQLSRYAMSGWLGHAIGYALAGLGVQYVGSPFTFLGLALLPLAAVLVVSQSEQKGLFWKQWRFGSRPAPVPKGC